MANSRKKIARQQERAQWERLQSSQARELTQAHVELENPELLAVIRIRHDRSEIYLVEVAVPDFLKGDTEAHRPVGLRSGKDFPFITYIYLSNLKSLQHSIRKRIHFSRWMSRGEVLFQRMVAGEGMGDWLIDYAADYGAFRR